MFVFTIAILLTAIASLIGIFIAYWTQKEMKQYLKWIEYCYIFSLVLFAVSLLVTFSNGVLPLLGLLFGVSVVFFIDKFASKNELGKTSEYWVLIAAGLAGVFAVNQAWGFIVAYIVSLHNMFYSSLNILPFVREKNYNGMLQVAEIVLYLATGLIVYYVLSTGVISTAIFNFAIAGALFYLFFKKS